MRLEHRARVIACAVTLGLIASFPAQVNFTSEGRLACQALTAAAGTSPSHWFTPPPVPNFMVVS
jgi:hypothetical protein